MHICGVIAEYDPFHTGHARQIAAARELLGADCAVVCAMSGNWTQRGGPALIGKHTRARLALMGGADLVLELPLPWAISSAEGFARGGVGVLAASGVVTHLCFGSETGELSPLKQAARCLDSGEYPQALRPFLEQGLSFPAARQRAVQELLGGGGDCLSLPNDNLGVEYLRALARLGSPIAPIALRREGAGHGEGPRDGYTSASHLRRLLLSGDWDQAGPYFIPGEAALLRQHPLADFSLAERAVLYRLRQMTVQELTALPDCGEGLSNRLHRAIGLGVSVEEVLTLAKTKRYPHARLRRILLWAFLSLTAADRPEEPPYLRVLAMNKTGRSLLREMGKKATAPVLTRPAQVKAMSPEARSLFELEARAADLYGLCLPQPAPCGGEWRASPWITDE